MLTHLPFSTQMLPLWSDSTLSCLLSSPPVSSRESYRETETHRVTAGYNYQVSHDSLARRHLVFTFSHRLLGPRAKAQIKQPVQLKVQ